MSDTARSSCFAVAHWRTTLQNAEYRGISESPQPQAMRPSGLSQTSRLDRSEMVRRISVRGSRLLVRASPRTITVVFGVTLTIKPFSKSASEPP